MQMLAGACCLLSRGGRRVVKRPVAGSRRCRRSSVEWECRIIGEAELRSTSKAVLLALPSLPNVVVGPCLVLGPGGG
jgi:hypothetical protein